MSYELLALFMGLFGGLHCVAMCGPLVMALPLAGNNPWFNVIQRLLYQSGRILTYSVFGFLAGFIGKGFNILGLQQILSLLTAVFLIAIAVYHFSGRKATRLDAFQVRMVAPIASLMGKWFTKPYGGLFAGSLHGFLPCGMVYMAIAASLNTNSPLDGSKFMFFFGLGTTPLLLIASTIPVFLRKFRAPAMMIPTLYFIAGVFLLFRGTNLEIPYISSPVKINSTEICK